MLRFLSIVCAGQMLISFPGAAFAQKSRDEILAEIAKVNGKARFDENLPGAPIVEVDL